MYPPSFIFYIKMKLVFLSLGSNKGNRLKNILGGLIKLKDIFKKTDISSIYLSKPWGGAPPPFYLNLVFKGYTDLDPKELLNLLQKIEERFGRREKNRYLPRELDIDILFYEKLIMADKSLVIPHPLLHKRGFVIVPFCEIAPDFIHPIFNKKIKDFLVKDMREELKIVIRKEGIRI